jgi:hypothetical protein
MIDYYSLMQCEQLWQYVGTYAACNKFVARACLTSLMQVAGEHLVMPINTGYSRTAAIYGLDLVWWFENEHLVRVVSTRIKISRSSNSDDFPLVIAGTKNAAFPRLPLSTSKGATTSRIQNVPSWLVKNM